jgi:hypothetical protein
MKRERRDKDGKIKDTLWERFKSWRLGRKLRTGKLPRGRTAPDKAIEAVHGTCRGEMTEIWGFLSAKLFHADGTFDDLGLISVRKITVAFRDYIVDSLQNSTTDPLDDFKFHGSGTGVVGEANTDTTLGTEVESRTSGTQLEGATADIYKTVATIAYTATRAITEHGVFSASTAGTLMDRSVFAAINVVNTDSIEFTYEATFNAEA